MEKRKETNILRITYEKELADSKKLVDSIKSSGWVNPDPEMVIVNCFPEYSSRIAQLVNHKLSYINSNELFQIVNLEMPYPNMAQVWNSCDRKYQSFYNYMSDWVRFNVHSTCTYLFVSASENLSQLRTFLRVKLEPEDYRTASLYVKEGEQAPDFWVEKYETRTLFEWENMNNPNKNKQ